VLIAPLEMVISSLDTLRTSLDKGDLCAMDLEKRGVYTVESVKIKEEREQAQVQVLRNSVAGIYLDFEESV